MHKNKWIVYFFIDSPMSFFMKTYVFDICKNRLVEAILTITQNVWFVKNTVQKYLLFMFQMGPHQASV